MKSRWFCAGYAAFLLVIIGLADSGAARGFFRLVQSLPGADKAGHFLLIGTLAFALNLAMQNRRIAPRKHALLTGSMIVFILMTLEEVSQVCFPHRHFDPLDWLANTLGILVLGSCAVWFTPPPAQPHRK